MHRSFVKIEEARTVTHNVDRITSKMVSAALQADVGGGQTASIYQSYHHGIVRPVNLLLSKSDLERTPKDVVALLQEKADERIYNNMASSSSRFQSELYKLALILYIQARDPKADVDRAIRMQTQTLRDVAETWGHYADMDKVFPNDRDYPGSPQRLPNMLKAVEAAMRQSLKDQKISKDIEVTPY